MAITYDPAKRDRTLAERGLDFEDAALGFAGPVVTFEGVRQHYGECRIVTAGFLAGRMTIIIWTPRGQDRHVFSMRKANVREQKRYAPLIR
ncbi:BrnT family toxin [Methylobacterium sp. C33D]